MAAMVEDFNAAIPAVVSFSISADAIACTCVDVMAVACPGVRAANCSVFKLAIWAVLSEANCLVVKLAT